MDDSTPWLVEAGGSKRKGGEEGADRAKRAAVAKAKARASKDWNDILNHLMKVLTKLSLTNSCDLGLITGAIFHTFIIEKESNLVTWRNKRRRRARSITTRRQPNRRITE